MTVDTVKARIDCDKRETELNPEQTRKRMCAPAKWVLMLTLLLVLELVGILATPALTRWYDTQFHIPGREGWGAFGTVLWELLLIAGTALLWLISFIWWLAPAITGKAKRAQ